MTTQAAVPALAISGVNHAFTLDGEDLAVVKNFSLTVKPGEFVSLLGPSGCGKSTLLRLVAGLDKPSDGRIEADGKLVTEPEPSRILAFQDATLFPWATVWNNVATGLAARGELPAKRSKVDEAISLVQLDGFANAYPHQLSGGMAQRAALARALVNDPHLLLLDEPFGRLDSLTRMALQEELRSLWQTKRFTVLMVTHDIEEALLLSDRIVVISNRPATIVEDIPISIPYPRHRDDKRIVSLRTRVLEKLGLGSFH
ncbi:ABC transporter ATP-binding protein [Aestuariivirga sp.]|uniref:ABC transporter ATP-binding protein n=1 Tax=Aestuariivirga sp. TaxID=2650926 RepID=UPI0039E4C33E